MTESINKLEKNKWPSLLHEIPDTPQGLFIRGELPDSSHKFLCVVGSRRYSPYGKFAVEKLISGLRGYKIAVVSGLALGIDALAHKSALDAGLKTIAIPGSGLNEKVLYPRINLSLARKIVDKGGALLSEFDENFRATPYSFPQRNRIMAGISHATLIIEAEERSGTLITARLANEYNREVLAVPGPINSKTSLGVNRLIADGAKIVLNSESIIEGLGLLEIKKSPEVENLSEEERLVISILNAPISKDELVENLDMDIREINILLASMELKGLIKEEFGKIYSQIT